MSASGSIYDLGYQGYDGRRLGRLPVALGLLRATLAAAYGMGRGGRAKIAPFVLAGLGLLPAILAVGIAALAAQAGAGDAIGDASPIRHDTYQSLTSTLVMLFCAAQAPELFGRDQRYGVLPLFFSRALTRLDYALARSGGLFLAVFLMSVAPQVVLSLGTVLAASDPLAGIAKAAPDVPRYLGVTILGSGLLATVAATIAAWTPRRAYATAAIIAVFIIPSVVAVVVAQLSAGGLASVLVILSPADLVDGLNAAVFGTIAESPAVAAAGLPGWVFVAAAIGWIMALLGVILRRYQRIDG